MTNNNKSSGYHHHKLPRLSPDATNTKSRKHKTKSPKHKKGRKTKSKLPHTPRWIPNAIDLKQLPRISSDTPARPCVSMETLREQRKSMMGMLRRHKETKREDEKTQSDTRRRSSARLAANSDGVDLSMETNSTSSVQSLNDGIIQDLIKRIAAIPIKNRPVPSSSDPRELGFELKIRLATRAPVLDVSIDATGRNHVTAKRINKRHIPVYDVTDEEDPIVNCLIKITTKYCGKK